MENIKISVKHNSWSEVFDMLVILGGKSKTYKDHYGDNKGWLFLHNGIIWTGLFDDEERECREVVFKELKDLVVLKRNDVGDSTHEDYQKNVWLVTGDDKYMMQDGEWELRGDAPLLLKPIEKTMKEYLVKSAKDGSYIYTQAEFASGDGVIEIPKGMDYAYNNDQGVLFLKSSIGYNHPLLIWQRNPETVKVKFDELDNCVGDELKYSHYRKDVSHLDVLDVYRVLELFDVTNPCLQHAVKKLLCSGQRGVKDSDKDIHEAIDSLQRYVEMRIEDEDK